MRDSDRADQTALISVVKWLIGEIFIGRSSDPSERHLTVLSQGILLIPFENIFRILRRLTPSSLENDQLFIIMTNGVDGG